MPFVPVPDKNAGDTFTQAMWATHVEGNLNAGVDRPLFDSGFLGAGAGSVDILSIPQTFAHLLLVVYLRGDAAAVDQVNAAVRVNGDSGSNYLYENLVGLNAAASTSLTTATSGVIGAISGGAALANTFGAGDVLIPAYTGAANQKYWTSRMANVTGVTGSSQLVGGRWVSVA